MKTKTPPGFTKMDVKYLPTINKSAALQSFLYDMNLLPEQLKPQSREWQMMKLVVCGYLVAQKEKAGKSKS